MKRVFKWDEWSGKAILFQVVAQSVLGIYLATLYHPTTASAYKDVSGMPAILRGTHYWGGGILILHLLVHVLLSAWTGIYRTEKIRHTAAVLLLPTALVLQVTGNLLPYDRHGVQTVVIESGIARQIPFVGDLSARLILGGDTFTESTVQRWYLGHWILGCLVLVFAFIAGGKGSYLRVQLLIPLAAAFLLAVLFPAPLSSPATAADTNAYNAAPGWYVLPLHSLLVTTNRFFNAGWIGVAVIPGLFVLALLLLPWLKSKGLTTVAKGLVACVTLFCAVSIVALGLKSAPVVGKRDPKETVVGPKLAPNEGQDPELAQLGRTIFQREGCANCHGQDGLKGEFGPSLADVHMRQSEADYYIRFIQNPKEVKSNSEMPGFPNLNEEELRALAEFLRFPRVAQTQ